jgi:hypothetical protein
MKEIEHNRANFRAVTESTQDDWQLIGRELQSFARKLPERLIAHLKGHAGAFGAYWTLLGTNGEWTGSDWTLKRSSK